MIIITLENGSIGFLSFLYVNTQNTFDLQTNNNRNQVMKKLSICLLYTSDAADERSSVDLGGRRSIKKKQKNKTRTKKTDV